MNLHAVKEWIAAGDVASVESVWLDAVVEGEPLEQMLPALEALMEAGCADSAETLAATLMEERYEQADPADALAAVKALAMIVPDSDELRTRAADLYKQVHGRSEHFDAIFDAAGLLSGQSPRRALRTLDVCLGLGPGAHLANRYDGRVMKVVGYQPATGEFEIADAAGRTEQLEPKLLADEYEPVDDRDFRVLAQHRMAEAKVLLTSDPAAVLIGLCISHGGKINADQLKDALVGKFLDAKAWSGWWSRARTAAKRCEQLSLAGRSPIVVSYHAGGRTLEQELTGALGQARTPGDYRAMLQQYLREARGRKVQIDPRFAGRITEALAEQARSFRERWPADALAAALAVESAVRSKAPAPSEPYPSSSEMLAGAERPEELLGGLSDESLWLAGLDGLCARDDAPDRLSRLLYSAPASRLDVVVERLAAAGDDGTAAAKAAADAVADPAAHLELFLWLWAGPARPVAGVPGTLEMLARMLKAVGDLARQWDVEAATRKEAFRRVRAALSASDYASFRAAVDAMDEHVADTLKRQIERLDGLAESVRQHALDILRERFAGLFFVRERLAPWEDPNAIWTTEAAMESRQAEYKELTETKMLENARAIGAAAAHGDLSENSEWKFAIEERNMLQARAAKMQDELARARVLHPDDVPTDSVGIGSRVTLKSDDDGRQVELTFLGPWEAAPDRRIYSYQSPAAQRLMGLAVGEAVEMKLQGVEGTYRVERIASALEG